MSQATAVESQAPELLGHPRGIFLIFSTEVWERFSFFGMRGLLILFLTASTLDHGFGWGYAEAIRLYASYAASVYILPIIGGYIGERYLGRRRAVLTGAALMMAGHFLMALPAAVPGLAGLATSFDISAALYESGIVLGLPRVPEGAPALWQALPAASNGERAPITLISVAYLGVSWSFYGALTLILLGTGFFKANMATMVGELYAPEDQRREAGYTIYYAGANLGAFAANLVAGTVGEVWGWHWGFSVAGIGMAIGCIAFYRNAPRLLAGIGEVSPVAREPLRLSRGEWHRVAGIVLMSLFTIVFWMGFEQGAGLLNIMIRDSVDRSVFGLDVPVTWFQSLNPMFIFLLAPLFVAIWGWFQARGMDPHPTRKYAFGLSMMGASFALLLGAQAEVDATGVCSPLWFVAVFFLQTVGELALSPVSKALVSRHAPERVAAPLMGAEFACYAAGAWLAGAVAVSAVSGSPADAFRWLLLFSVAAAIGCLLIRPVVDRLLSPAVRPDGSSAQAGA